jgi:hypothetical protein
MLSRFKHWLKRSGMYVDNNHSLEIIDSLNPLDAVIETSAYPWAKIYRNTVWEGIIDAYHIFVGNHVNLHDQTSGRIGIIDILIFPLIVRRLIDFGFRAHRRANQIATQALSRAWSIVGVFLVIVGLMLDIPRHVIGVILAVLFSPVVALVHLILYSKKAKLEEDINNLMVKQRIDDPNIMDVLLPCVGRRDLEERQFYPPLPDTGKKWWELKESVAETKVEEVRFNDAYCRKYLTGRNLMTLRTENIDEKNSALDKSPSWLEIYRHPEGYGANSLMGVIKVNHRNKKGIQALLSTNYSRITEHLEREGKLVALEEELLYPKRCRDVLFAAKSKSNCQSAAHKFFRSKEYDSTSLQSIFEYADLMPIRNKK